jgi:3-demethoxyubiquinol 3-hydroxylase
LNKRKLNSVDKFIDRADGLLSMSLGPAPLPARPSPAEQYDDGGQLDAAQKDHIAGLMRVNHSGEVCAQALYAGQALTAKATSTRYSMEQAAREEIDHMAWCKQRLDELESHPSRLNTLWYAMSFGLGAAAGLVSDRLSLGFVAATEQQVCEHLKSHLDELPVNDKKSRAVVSEMLADEARHATRALAAGGQQFATPVKKAMSILAKAMTLAAYRF